MASAVYSEHPASRLSIALEGEASASPFPSPSSSFLPPPTPGAHEFAVKPVPARNSRKLSATAHTSASTTPSSATPTAAPTTAAATTATNGDTIMHSALRIDMEKEKQPSPIPTNGVLVSSPSSSSLSSSSSSTAGANGQPPTPMLLSTKSSLQPAPPSPAQLSPLTPTPYTLQHHTSSSASSAIQPRSPVVEQSTSSSTTPTILTSALPPEDTDIPAAPHNTNNNDNMDVDGNDNEHPAQIIIPTNLDAGLTSFSGVGATPSSPSSPAFNSRPMSASLNSNRPAPPSPAMSRRVSGVPSLSSASNASNTSNSGKSRGSRPPSMSISRSNSLRKATGAAASRGASPVMQPHRLSQSFIPPLSPQNLTFGLNVPTASTSSQPQSPSLTTPLTPSTPTAATAARTSIPVSIPPATATPQQQNTYIKIRDFGFPPSDERHIGLGPDVPRPNIVRRLNRKLGAPRTMSTASAGSMTSSEGDGDEDGEGWGDDEDGDYDEGGGGGWGSGLLGRLSWLGAAAAAGNERSGVMPSQSEMEINFAGDGDNVEGEDGYENGEEEGEGEEEEEDTLYPGLYRAVYAFEPEGIAEMRLVEDQIVRVVGRGGGVGWAVVVDESASTDAGAGAATERAEVGGEGEKEKVVKHALVPESYLEPVRLDWEDEEGVIVGAA